MRHRLVLAGVTCLGLSGAALLAQPTDGVSVQEVLRRVDAYLASYETSLAALTAEESFEQREVVQLPVRRHPAGSIPTDGVPWSHTRARRKLLSDVAFLRLPGNAEWAGFRSVQQVDGERVAEADVRLSTLVAGGADHLEQARAITAISSKYNLGTPRTTNMPTVPLEIFHPRHRVRFNYRLDGTASIRGARTVRLAFQERATPTVIRSPDGGDVKSLGAAWVDPVAGTLWRIEVFFQDPTIGQTPSRSDVRIRVDFGLDARLGLMVPVEMHEVFSVPGGRGEGRATYRNFKRFETGARIVP